MKPITSRVCKWCRIDKPIEDFYRDKSYNDGIGRSYSCKKCAKKYQREYNRKNRKKVTDASRNKRRRIKSILVEENGGKCIICGYNRYPGALEFHHRDPNEKDLHVSSTGIHKAREEAKKCILVCSNCHMELHGGIISLDDI